MDPCRILGISAEFHESHWNFLDQCEFLGTHSDFHFHHTHTHIFTLSPHTHTLTLTHTRPHTHTLTCPLACVQTPTRTHIYTLHTQHTQHTCWLILGYCMWVLKKICVDRIDPWIYFATRSIRGSIFWTPLILGSIFWIGSIHGSIFWSSSIRGSILDPINLWIYLVDPQRQRFH